MNNKSDREGRLELPAEIVEDAGAVELISAWYSKNQIRIMTRWGTGLDHNPGIWGEILVSIAENAALSVQNVLGIPASETLTKIKESLDQNWRPEVC